MTKEEASAILDDMKVKIDIPHAAVMQHKRNEALDMAISALKGGWIPVEKREPEDIGNYIVTLDYDVHGRVVSQCFYHGKAIRWADFNDSVTAWRDDIEPYKKGE